MNDMPPETSDSVRTVAPNTDATLRHVLAAIEKNSHQGRTELVLAILLSLATLASTWCGYQAKAWGGEENTNRAAADTAERKAAEDTIIALQTRTFDGLELLSYWTALRDEDTKTAETVLAKMRPVLRKALEASIAAGALHDPKVPGPLQRPEYVLTEELDAKSLRDEAGLLSAAAHKAAQASGDYVSLTLMFASVLFFGGITGTFTDRRIRIALGCVAVVIFIVTCAILLRLPIHQE